MIIWRGWGILVVFAAIAGLWLGIGVVGASLTVEPAYAKASLSVAIGLFITAVLAFGIWLLRFFRLIDAPIATTGPDQKPRRASSALFFIPLVAWPIIFSVLGVLGLVVGFGEVGSA